MPARLGMIGVTIGTIKVRQALLMGLPGIQTRVVVAQRAVPFGGAQGRDQYAGNCLGYFVL